MALLGQADRVRLTAHPRATDPATVRLGQAVGDDLVERSQKEQLVATLHHALSDTVCVVVMHGNFDVTDIKVVELVVIRRRRDHDVRRNPKFRPIKYVAEETKDVWWCNCKQAKKRPFCDGTHKLDFVQKQQAVKN